MLRVVCARGREEFDEWTRSCKSAKEQWLKEDARRRPEDYPPPELEESYRGFVLEYLMTSIRLIESKGFLRAFSNDADLKRLYLAYLYRQRAEAAERLKRLEAEIQRLGT
jgi:hypothetical protein